MVQLKKVIDPFGEVNVYPAGSGRTRVQATILMEPHREGTQTGIALDGSGSMAELYGINAGILSSSIFAKQPAQNAVSPVAQQICAYLARKLDADGGTTVIYWSTGPAGTQIQEIGDFTAEQAEQHHFTAPNNFGTGTRLLPAVKYFIDRFKDAPWGFYVFLTDGEMHDLQEVKDYSRQLAQAIANGQRNPVKLVLVGLGADVNERQMLELDDLDTGTNIDLWDHKLAVELRVLHQIFAEVVDQNARIAPHGKLLDDKGNLVKDFSDTGVPAVLEFEIDASAKYFTLHVPGHYLHQNLADDVLPPASEIAEGEVRHELSGDPLEDVQTTPEEVEFTNETKSEFDFDLEVRQDDPDIDLQRDN